MKRLVVSLMALLLVISLCACGGEKTEKPANPSPASSAAEPEDEITESKEPLVLTDGKEYCVCRLQDDHVSVSSLKELKNYTVGCVNNTDSQLIGNYYCDDVRLGGSDMDVLNYLGSGGSCQFVIISKGGADEYVAKGKLDIVLYPLVFED